MSQRTIIIGDVHGCLVELEELLHKVAATDRDHLVFVGDLVDRGPYSTDVVQLVQQLCDMRGAVCVLGNHEFKYRRRGASTRTPPFTLTESDLDWFESLPFYCQTDFGLVVHGGLCPRRHRQLEDLNHPKYKTRLLFTRNVDTDGKSVPIKGSHLGRHLWAEAYDGRFGPVIFGHQPLPRVTVYPHAIGLDTGCCFGGQLSCLVIGDHGVQVVGVPAREAYSSLIDDPISPGPIAFKS